MKNFLKYVFWKCFGYVETILYCCSKVKIDGANFYFQILKDVRDQSRTFYH